MSTAPENPLIKNDDDVLCISCGYNLRGLGLDVACPECGTSVERSRRGDQLVYADPQWLQRIVRGHFMIMWGVNGLMVAFGLTLVLLIASAQLDWVGRILRSGWFIAPLLMLAGSVLSAIGIVPLTRADPRDSAVEPRLSPRRVVRAALVGLIMLVVIFTALGSFAATTFLTGHVVVRAGAVVLIGATAIIAFRAFTSHLIGLLQRVPNASVVEALRDKRKHITAAAILVMLWYGSIFVGPGPGGLAGGGSELPRSAIEYALFFAFFAFAAIGCVGPLAALALIFYTIALVRVLRQSQRVLRAVQQQQEYLHPPG